MVKLNQKQREPKRRGYTQRINENRIWTALDLNQRTIVGFFERGERESGEQDWPRLENACKVHIVPHWDQEIDGQRVIYTCVDGNCCSAIKSAASRAHIALSTGVAYPSKELVEAVQQVLLHTSTYTFYQVDIGGAIPGQSPGIYIVFENEGAYPIYVGRTRQLLSQRLAGHKHSQRKPGESAGFMDYMRHHHKFSHSWPIQFLSYEQCESIAILGQLTPDLVDDGTSQHLLTKKYSEDYSWGLAQAEAALIASFRPHFNQEKNTYRHPLEQTDYCQQYCRICLRPSHGR